MIPLPGQRPIPTAISGGNMPIAPVRWGIRLLAMIAAGVAAYLTYKAINLQSVAGCAPTANIDCDIVLQSRWSKWLGVPVAMLGLAAYITLLALSFVAGRGRSAAAQWASTALLMFALVVAGAGLWFDSLQLFSVEKFCIYCIGVHLCGLTIAGLALWWAIRERGRAVPVRNVGALAGTFRPVAGMVRPVGPPPSAGPSFLFACCGAAALLAILIGGQLLFPPKLQMSEIVLSTPIEMNNSVAATSPTAEEHVVNRIPPEDTATGSPTTSSSASDNHSSATDSKPKADPASKDHAAKSSSAESKPSEPDTPKLSRKVSFLKGSLTIDMYQQAVIGSPTAPHVVIELVDYACPHCRAMHQTIQKAIDRYGDQLAIVVMPMPLELECNKLMEKTEATHLGACKLARWALAVAEVDPGAFVDFHEWLMADKDKIPPTDRAISKAYRLADPKKLRERVNSDEIEQKIQRNIQLYSTLSAEQARDSKPFGLPVQIVGDEVISGDTVTGDELLAKWEEALGMKPL